MGNLKKAKLARQQTVASCKFKTWLDTLDDEDRETVHEILYDLTWTATQAVAFFTEEGGCPVSLTSLLRHRNRTCTSCNSAVG